MGCSGSKPSEQQQQLPIQVRAEVNGEVVTVDFFPKVFKRYLPVMPNQRTIDYKSISEKSELQPDNFRMLIYDPELPFMIQYAQDTVIHKVDFMYIMQRMFGCCLVDGTNTLPGLIKTKILDPMPRFDQIFNSTLEQVCNQRANEIVRIALSKPCQIYFLWSGGIDSTAALIALIKVFKEQELKKYLIVCCTKRSVQEYPLFYQTHYFKLTFHKYEEEELFPCLAKISDGMIVTGEHGDQIFGSYLMAKAFMAKTLYVGCKAFKNYLHQSLDKEWQIFMPWVLEESGILPDKQGQAWLMWISQQVAKCPIIVVTVRDFLWWINFSMKWQHVTVRMLWKLQGVESDENIYHFYRTEQFQQWSFHNHQAKLKNNEDWATYKWPLKEYIYDYTKDQRYLLHKIKENSLRLNTRLDYEFYRKYVGIDENLNYIGWALDSTCITAMKFKYGQGALTHLLNQNLSTIGFRQITFEDQYLYSKIFGGTKEGIFDQYWEQKRSYAQTLQAGCVAGRMCCVAGAVCCGASAVLCSTCCQECMDGCCTCCAEFNECCCEGGGHYGGGWGG